MQTQVGSAEWHEEAIGCDRCEVVHWLRYHNKIGGQYDKNFVYDDLFMLVGASRQMFRGTS